jgi:DNA-binding MarR family transcriptional regulator
VASLPFDPIAEARRQWSVHGWGDPEAMAVITSIVRVEQLLSARVNNVLQPLGLTFARYEALVLLYFTRKGALPLGKMSERLQVHPTSITSVVDRLENQGFVRRIPSPTDRRTVLAEILPAGRRIVELSTPEVVSGVFTQLEWTPNELQTIFNLFGKLRRVAGDFDQK